jgi:sphingolipid 4-desaturase/C4-monooxygenase
MVSTKVQSHDFWWSAGGEPHVQRRKEILAKYGDQIRKLYGYDNSTAVVVVCVCLVHVLTAYLVRNADLAPLFIVAWLVGGTCNQNLMCAQHELSHFLAFRKPVYNKMLSIASNMPLAIPMATAFRKYHQEHHSDMGVDGVDVDLPTFFEADLICNSLLKTCFCAVYLLIYGVRPLLVRPKQAGKEELINFVAVIGFDAVVLYLFGWKSLLYLLLSAPLGGGLHPLAGHLIAEHYMFRKGQETYSYYGPLNAFSYNVGYHNEHHDFPQIPHTRLHKLREIAPEYYSNRYYHTSWCWVIYKFITDPDMGPWSRMRRKQRTGPLDPLMGPQQPAADVQAKKAE